IVTAGLHAKQRGRIVGPVDAGGDDHHAPDLEPLMKGGHFLRQGRLGGIRAAGEKREFLRIAENVRMTIAGAVGNLEIHRCRWWRRFPKPDLSAHESSRGNGCADQKLSTRQYYTSAHRRLLEFLDVSPLTSFQNARPIEIGQ